MKALIDRHGTLIIEPETETEAYAITMWKQHNMERLERMMATGSADWKIRYKALDIKEKPEDV